MKRLTGKAFAFVSNENSSPEYAIDGNPNTKWSASGFYSWWMYELDTLCHIESIILDTADGGEYKYFIESSADSINWSLIAEKDKASVCNKCGDRWSVNCTAKYIKVTFRYNSLGQIVSLGRFECFGKEQSDFAPKKTAGSRFFAVNNTENKGFELLETVDDLTNLPIKAMAATTAPSYLKYESVDFGDGANEMQGYFGFPVQDKRLPKKYLAHVELKIDSLEGSVIGTFEAFRQWMVFGPLACDIKETKGVHDVYLILKDIDENQSFYVEWLSFVKAAVLPNPEAPYVEIEQTNEFNAYIGLLHSHTCLSDGMNTPMFACKYAREVANLDFLGITEHSNLFDNPYDSLHSRKLRDLKEYTEIETEPGKFVALFGSETTWYNGFGHMNIYDEESLYLNVCQVKYNDSKVYYDTVKKYPHAINQWNHPWSCGFRHLDLFSPFDPELDKVMYTIEMNPEEDPDNFGLNYYIKALEEGYHVAPCGSQDNHKENWGTYSSLRTGIVSPFLTKEHLLDSIRHRRVYFTCAPKLRIQFRVNGKIMGSRIPACKEYRFDIDANNQDDRHLIKSIEILGSKGRVALQKDVCETSVKETLSLRDGTEKYYFAKITLDDDSFAVSSPVWIE